MSPFKADSAQGASQYREDFLFKGQTGFSTFLRSHSLEKEKAAEKILSNRVLKPVHKFGFNPICHQLFHSIVNGSKIRLNEAVESKLLAALPSF